MIAVGDHECEAVRETLGQLGFQRQTNEGFFFEGCSVCVGSLPFEGEVFQLHVYIIPADSPEADDMRFFRTCMRADPELLKAYVARKREIVSDGITDAAAYVREKSKFIQAMLG